MVLSAQSAATAQGICDRTSQVRDKLLEITGVSACADVTSTHLEGVTELNLTGAGITALEEGDFSGLTNLNELELSENSLTTLPEGIFSGLTNLEYLWLDDNSSLTTLPVGIFSGLTNLKWLELFDNSLTSVPVGIFSGLSSLTDLSLYDNSLTSLPVEIFSGLSNLTDLGLGNNSLTALPEEIFSGLRNLEWLQLYGNSLTSLPEGIFSGLTKLRILGLNNNSLTTLPEGIFSGLGNLKQLSLRNNSLTSLPEGIFSGLTKLNTLFLYDNDLTQLPATVFNGLDGLKLLHLKDNRFQDLPSGIFDDVLDTLGDGDAGQLHLDSYLKATLSFASTAQTVSEGTAVQVSATLSRTLPVAVRVPFTIGGSATDDDYEGLSPAADSGLLFLAGETSKEITFTLSQNNDNQEETLVLTLAQLSGIGLRRSDGTGADAPHLETENLLNHSGSSSTHTVTIPKPSGGICGRTSQVRDKLLELTGVSGCGNVTSTHLEGVTSLIVSHSSISSVKEGDFSRLTQLTHLKLDNNSLTSLPEGIFSGLSSLKELDLRSNSLSSLSEGIFSNLSALQFLFLFNNRLSTLPAGIFSGLSNLKRVGLSNNSLSTLPASVFSGLSNLERLDFFGNPLTAIPVTVFSGLNSLKDLQMHSTSLSALPAGIFDGVLDTLGASTSSSIELSVDGDLKATLSFASTAQTASEGTTVRVSATLSRALPVAVRVPFTISGSATDDDYEGLSPAADSGLLFLAGETSKEITFTLSENNDNQEETLVLTLAQLSGIGLRRSDGTGTDAPHLKTERLLSRSAASSTHTVTIPKASGGICDRTTQVRDKLLEVIGVSGCGDVTSTHLEGVTSLDLSLSSISALQAGDFSGLTQLTHLKLDNNSLTGLPGGIFSGLSRLQELDLRSNSLSGLPAGIFDDILDTLGSNPGVNGLSVDSSLKATLSFASTAQTVSEGTAVRVSATLSRTLPVAVRVPFTINGSATDDDYEGLSPPADSGLLFLAGETSKEITFTLSENDDNQEETLVLTLAQLSGIGLRRSDGTGTDASHLETARLLNRSAASSTHTLTISPPSGGICDRTTQVRDKLLELTGVSGCGNVTSTHLEGVTSLIVSHSSISSVKAGDFSGLTQLTLLMLDNNSLTNLPEGIFSGLSNLQELDLRSNSLSAVPAGIFSNLSSLQLLSLTNNRLSTLPAGIFSGLGNLKRVGLSSNSLTSLSASIFSGLSNLTTLHLSHNSLTSLAASIFSGLSNLEHLDFAGNPLTSIPVTIFSGLNSLEILHIGAISLTSLPAGIFDDILDTLGADPGVNGLTVDSSLKATLSFASTAQTVSEGTAVQVRGTLSRTLPVAVRVPFSISGSATDDDYEGLSPAADSGLLFLAGETSKEITFTLSENNDDQEETLVLTLAQLSGIGLRRSDGTGTDASHLETEHLLNRSAASSEHTVTISAPSGGVCDRTSQVRDKLLELTGVSGCGNVTSTHLEGVTSLDLSLSSISALQEEDFSGLTRLVQLLLNDNSLVTLPEGVFSGLSHLKTLELSENSLSSLPEGIFQGLGSLESLRLWDNSLPRLPAGIFRGLSNLTFLSLDRNALRTLPEDIFSGLGEPGVAAVER